MKKYLGFFFFYLIFINSHLQKNEHIFAEHLKIQLVILASELHYKLITVGSILFAPSEQILHYLLTSYC